MPPVSATTIRLFGREGCHPCKIVRAALDRAGLNIEYHDIEVEPEAREHVRQLGWDGVPVVEHAGGSWQGPLADKIRELAESHRVSSAAA